MRAIVVVLAVSVLGPMGAAQAPTSGLASVTGVVSVVRTTKEAAGNGNAAIWLKAVVEPGQESRDKLVPRTGLKIIQQNKRFEPHMLVAPVGSVVEFPNLDPFFHNVFSLFDGKRFDLGLYEAGTSRTVPFTRAGICYVFCNIHPEMSAVVVVVDTPYYATTNQAGAFTVAGLPPGRYLLSIWHERYKPERPQDFPREVIVSAPATSVGTLHLIESEDMIMSHKNKYGRDYDPPAPGALYKGR